MIPSYICISKICTCWCILNDIVTVWIVNVPICIKSREQNSLYLLCNRLALEWLRPYDLLNHPRSTHKDGKWYIISHDAPSDIFFHNVVPNWFCIWKLMVETYKRHLWGQITLFYGLDGQMYFFHRCLIVPMSLDLHFSRRCPSILLLDGREDHALHQRGNKGEWIGRLLSRWYGWPSIYENSILTHQSWVLLSWCGSTWLKMWGSRNIPLRSIGPRWLALSQLVH